MVLPVVKAMNSSIFEYEAACREKDFDGIFGWCMEHYFVCDDEEVAKKVAEGFFICAENGYEPSVSYLNLGTMYYSGIGVEQDYKKAAEYYEISAEDGNIRAICNLGYCYYYGRHTNKDYEKAYKHFDIGALMDDANCLYKLGDMYRYGYYVEKNEEFAVALYVKAHEEADEEDEDILPDIEFRLGEIALRGIGRPVDIDCAMYFLCNALTGFYRKRNSNPFVGKSIESCKELLRECESIIDNE